MELTGTIITVLPPATGTGKNGIWKKQEFIMETKGQVTRKVCLSVWGDKIDQFRLNEGEDAEVFFDLESREFNGRWYTEAKAWKIVKKEADIPGSVKPGENTGEIEATAADDLPF